MPKILVCYKWVMDEQDIRIVPEDFSLDTSRVKYKISEYDKNAIEEAVKLREVGGGYVDAITFGSSAVKQSFKDVLSRGPDKVYAIIDELAKKADAYVAANVLAAAIRRLGSYDLIICAEGSSDTYNQQMVSRLAVLLGVPGITFVKQIKMDDDKVVATRKLDDCIEIVGINGPTVISVLPEINKARIPSLKHVLAASKKPTEELKIAKLDLHVEELLPKVVDLSVNGYIMKRKNNVFKESNQAENVAKLIDCLSREGLV